MARVVVLLALAAAAAAAPKKLLYITHSAGFVHGSIPTSQRVIDAIGRRSGAFDVTVSEDTGLLNADTLRDYDAVFFFTSGELPLNEEQKAALLAFVRGGKGFGGAHSATDTFYQWPEYGELIGGYFDGHPWTQTASIDIEDPDHPATRGLGNGFRLREEYYQFRAFSRQQVRVLMTLDTGSVDLRAEGVNRSDEDFALAWCRPYGEGRVFYTALGHFDETWEDSRFQKSLEGALRWLVGDLAGEAAPRRSTPVVTRISNAAYESPEAISPGLLTAITGAGLTTGSSMRSDAIPLPVKLAGTQVRVDGLPAKLISVSPERIVALMPGTVSGTASIVVTTAGGGRSIEAAVPVARATPGIVSVTRNASLLTILATGLGRETDVEVVIGPDRTMALFAGPALDMEGLWQINALVPASVTGAYSVKIVVAGAESNAVDGPR